MSNQVIPVSSIYEIEDSYPFYVHILIPLVVIYLGIFVMLSNHHILRPRTEKFLNKVRINSVFAKELIIDFMSNLSGLSFLLGSIVLTQSDLGLQTVVISDSFWAGICMAIISYKNIQQTKQNLLDKKILAKNAILLCGIYGSVLYHYFAKNYFISLGASLLGVYLINLVLIGYEDKFLSIVNEMLEISPQIIEQNEYSHTNQLPSLQLLARVYPTRKYEISEKMEKYRNRLQKIRLKNKTYVASKLLQIALAVQISRNKIQEDLKRQVKQHYGSINGTLQKKSLRGTIVKPPSSPKPGFEINDLEENPLASSRSINDETEHSLLFCIFPIRMFEGSKVLSVVMSIFLNLGLGVLLDFATDVAATLQYGNYFRVLYAIMLLPMLPDTSKHNYFSAMCLASIWKYGMLGLFLLLWAINGGLTITFPVTNLLQYQVVISLSMVLTNLFLLCCGGKVQKVVGVLWLLGMIGHGTIMYYSVNI